jgi:hypothetical protein
MRVNRSIHPASRWRGTLVLLPVVFLAIACGGQEEGRVPVHPAHGRIFYKGKPVAGALVVFRKVGSTEKDGAPSPTGRTDSDGKFQLHTYVGNDGAPEGSYVVGISLTQGYTENRNLLENAKKKAVSKAPADLLGNRFIDPQKSGLKAEIKPGDNELEAFDLK